MIEWAAQSVERGAVVSTVKEMRQAKPPWLLHIRRGEETVRAVLKAGHDVESEIRTEVAALTVAVENGLPAPRVIAADLDGRAAGSPALLMTFLEGDATVSANLDPLRLRAMGAAAGAVHRVALRPSAELPVRHRHMPWIDFAQERREGLLPTTPLLDAGDQILREVGLAESGTVFLHGDLWSGNMMFLDGQHVATIDWEAAGVGNPGVDLGSLRLDAALMHGRGAADEVTIGWTQVIGEAPEDESLWDVVAALNTPADMCDVVPTLPEAGRADLDGATLNARRDEFLAAAIELIQRCQG